MQSKHQRTRVRILVKAFPQHSQKYEETVCCAGITDAGQLIRLFPITYRRLAAENDSIRVIERGKTLSDESKVMLWRPHVADSLEALQKENKATGRRLGIIQPDAGSTKFFWRDADAGEKEEAKGRAGIAFRAAAEASRSA